MGKPEITMIAHLDLSDVEQGLDRLQEKVNRLNAALAEAKRTADTLENEGISARAVPSISASLFSTSVDCLISSLNFFDSSSQTVFTICASSDLFI